LRIEKVGTAVACLSNVAGAFLRVSALRGEKVVSEIGSGCEAREIASFRAED